MGRADLRQQVRGAGRERSRRRVAEAAFVTLVAPLAAADPLPALAVRRHGRRTAVEVDWLGVRHAVAWRVDAEQLALEEPVLPAGGGS